MPSRLLLAVKFHLSILFSDLTRNKTFMLHAIEADRQVLQLINDLKSFREEARLIFRKECSKLYCSFHDQRKQLPGKQMCGITYFVSVFGYHQPNSGGKKAYQEFFPPFSFSDFENKKCRVALIKKKVSVKCITVIYLFTVTKKTIVFLMKTIEYGQATPRP